jgi:hypothetical protein
MNLIQENEYWANGSLILCTDNITSEEVDLLITTLNNKFSLILGKKSKN